MGHFLSKKWVKFQSKFSEIGASFVSAHLGIDGDDIQDNAKAYLKSWLQSLKDDHKYLWKAMGEASKAFEYLLDSATATTETLAA